MGIKECNVHRDISVIDLESHRDVAHGGTRVAAMEVSEALLIIRVQVGHDESRGNEEVAAEAVKVGPAFIHNSQHTNTYNANSRT